MSNEPFIMPCRSCQEPTQQRHAPDGTEYYSIPGDLKIHMCEEYLNNLRIGYFDIPEKWKGRIYASVDHWNIKSWAGCTRR